MKKKIILYANYFYPEFASTAQILTELCLGLKDQFDITVICSVPCYTGVIEPKYKTKKYYFEEFEGIKIIRVRVKDFDKNNKKSRISHILSYFFNSIGATFKVGKQDIVYTISQPPILGGILGRIGKIITKGKLIYNVQDFNPEQIMAVNYSKNKLIIRLMMFIDKQTCKKANLVITVGKDMQETLKKRFKNKNVPNNVVINNWTNDKEIYPLEKTNKKVTEFRKKYNIDDKFVIMYSGNIGLYYDLENLIRIIEKYKKNQDISFAIVGEGAIKSKLEEYVQSHQMSNVVFIPYQDKKDLIYSLNAANVHLVTNAMGIKGVSVPSKIYGCLATNVPIFGILEEGTEAYQIIVNSNCGIVTEPGNYKEIEKCLDEIVKNKYSFVKKHETGRKYLDTYLTKAKSIEKYQNEINKLVGDKNDN
ncbi:MAG: glycosyltransferase family 4 protein [Bacilli bacterium]